MENFINNYLENVKNALENGEINISDLVAMGCKFCPLREKCEAAADAGDNRSCELFIREEAKGLS